MAKRAVFIVIDGIDGSGKATQVALVKEALEKQGKTVATLDFPRYSEPSSLFVRKYLNGEYGALNTIGPQRASLFYALDRFDAKADIINKLKNHDFVLSNRYVSANLIHQSAKIDDDKMLDTFLRWEQNLEFSILGIPKPTKTILLHVSPRTSNSWVEDKEKRAYIKNGKNKDIHENDPGFMQKSADRALYVAKKLGWAIINCEEKGATVLKEVITEKILNILRPLKS